MSSSGVKVTGEEEEDLVFSICFLIRLFRCSIRYSSFFTIGFRGFSFTIGFSGLSTASLYVIFYFLTFSDYFLAAFLLLLLFLSFLPVFIGFSNILSCAFSGTSVSFSTNNYSSCSIGIAMGGGTVSNPAFYSCSSRPESSFSEGFSFCL